MGTEGTSEPQGAYYPRRMRWVALVGVVAAVAALGLAFGQGTAGAPRPLLPDLDQAPPSALSVRRHDGAWVLAFGSAVDNVGRGPLLIRGTHRAPGVMDVRQVVRRTDGSSVVRELGPLLRYERAETHSHWHLEAFDRYELRVAADPRKRVRGTKMGFCLGDRYDTDRTRRLPREPANPRWTHDCGRGETELTQLEEGISVGYGDDYAPYLEGQFISLAGVPAGRYLLVHTADPRGYLRELTRANNSSSLLLRLRRPPGERPRVTVLATCPGRATCSA
jgi:hypothetical protein